MKKEFYFILIVVISFASCKKSESDSTIVYQDNLSFDKKAWHTDSTSNHVRKFYQGHYFIRMDTINEFESSLAPFGTINYPYSVQVDGIIQLDNPNGLGFIGLRFNHIDATHYCIVQVYSNGEYSIYSYNNGWTAIVPLTYSSAIQSGNGAKNTLKIIQNTTTIELLINNNIIGTFSLSLPNSLIQVGIITGTAPNSFSNYYTPVTGLFNNFIIIKN